MRRQASASALRGYQPRAACRWPGARLGGQVGKGRGGRAPGCYMYTAYSILSELGNIGNVNEFTKATPTRPSEAFTGLTNGAMQVKYTFVKML